MTFTKKSLLVGILATVFLVWLSTYVPVPSGLTADGFHIALGIEIVEAVLFVFAAFVFVSSISEFKNEMRVAYSLLAIGFSILGLSQLQNPIFQALNLWESPWTLFGGMSFPAFIASTLIFLGTRKFARLCNLQCSWASFGKVLLVSILTAVVLHIVPHSAETESGYIWGWFSLTLALVAFTIVQLSYSLSMAVVVRGAIGATFVNAWAWLIIAYAVSLFACLQVPYFTLSSWYNPYVIQGYFDLVFVLAGACVVVAAYAFRRTAEY